MSFDLRRQKQPGFGQSSEFLIGELLLKAGVIKQNQLDEALKLAGNKHMQIGQMLIMARYINQADLQAAVDAQVSLRDRIIDMNCALRALATAHKTGMTFAEATQKESQQTSVVPVHKLGQILLDANLINPEQLSIAVQKSMATGLPVGRILILNNVISEPILAAALEVLIKLRDGNVGREEAAVYLNDISKAKNVNDLGVAGLEEASVFNSQPVLSTRKSIRLGEFLVLAGILSETDVMNALEFSLVGEKALGESLLEHGYVTREIIESALKLQSLIESDTLDCQKAAQCLSLVHNNKISLTQALETVSSAVADGTQLDFRTLLIDSKLLTHEDIHNATELAASNPRILAQILTQTGYLSSNQAGILIECHEVITQNAISQHDAKFVLDFCLQKLADNPITFAEGLQELGWSRADETTPAASSNTYEQDTPTEPNATAAKPPADIKNSGNFLGTNLAPASANQSFIPSTGNQPSVTNNAVVKPPSQAQEKSAQSTPSSSNKGKAHSLASVTGNMPALGNMPAGSELRTTQASPNTDKPLNLKSLLADDSDHAFMTEEESSVPTEADPVPDEADSQPIETGNVTTVEIKAVSDNIDDQGLELSESEKALIMKASSLTASPQEIMAAMKLAAKKDKSIQSQENLKATSKAAPKASPKTSEE